MLYSHAAAVPVPASDPESGFAEVNPLKVMNVLVTIAIRICTDTTDKTLIAVVCFVCIRMPCLLKGPHDFRYLSKKQQLFTSHLSSWEKKQVLNKSKSVSNCCGLSLLEPHNIDRSERSVATLSGASKQGQMGRRQPLNFGFYGSTVIMRTSFCC